MTGLRRPGIAAGAVLLALAAAGCSGLGRTAVGTVNYETEGARVITVSNPLVTGCHRMAPTGAHRVENATLIDMLLYTTPNCTGPGSNAYTGTTLFNNIAPGTAPWRSYSFVH
ncbi:MULTISPECIES: hypothetical protein [unclassified Streptomyces]|uniref:hypothetical protein n=1 Tax=unclassified Streptomyces TaxID=2593676 RepID=UPI0021C8FAEA|nr:hypothetical protein [Streptomyces sp. FIT100]UUN26259.1 hypothetical protein KK483_07360 [Streptomyces sp. FIT100]